MTTEETEEHAKDRTTDPSASRQAVLYGRLLPGAVSLGSPIGLGVARAPWEAVFLLSVFGLAVIGLQGVFPQSSADRLAWWRDRRHSRERRAIRRAKAAAEKRQPNRLNRQAERRR
jgi:hypothetical protein